MGRTMISGLIIPPGRRAIERVKLEPGNRRAYAAALGGQLYPLPSSPSFRGRIEVFASCRRSDGIGPVNARGALFVVGYFARGSVLILGSEDTDVPEGFIEYLKDQRFIKDEASI